MPALTWFSGKCRRLCIVEGKGAIATEESVYVFRAADRKAAIRRFLEMARRQDEDFVNGYGERTRWAVISLDTVDDLTEGPLTDMEVFSDISDIDPPDPTVSFDAQFTPDAPGPGRSGVPGNSIPEPKSARRSRKRSPAPKPRPQTRSPKRRTADP
jgi:hypothetical protein